MTFCCFFFQVLCFLLSVLCCKSFYQAKTTTKVWPGSPTASATASAMTKRSFLEEEARKKQCEHVGTCWNLRRFAPLTRIFHGLTALQLIA